MKRYDRNPLLTPQDVRPSREGYDVVGVFNAGVALVGARTCLLVRVAERPVSKDGFVSASVYTSNMGEVDLLCFKKDEVDLSDPRVMKTESAVYLTSLSHLRCAWSDDGIHFTVEDVPALFPDNEYESYGIEDARVTEIDGIYYINYSAVSRYGVATALATTRDFKNFDRRGIIFAADNKDVTIFPEQISGRYCAFHRPHVGALSKPSIWISYSDTLLEWGGHRCVAMPRNGFWDEMKVGGGAVPLKTREGWVAIYHGVDKSEVYSLGVLLLDSEDPSKVLARSRVPILAPQMEYETKGFFGNVVFCCGALLRGDGVVDLYYAAADESLCLAKTTIDDLLRSLV